MIFVVEFVYSSFTFIIQVDLALQCLEVVLIFDYWVQWFAYWKSLQAVYNCVIVKKFATKSVNFRTHSSTR